MNGFVSMLIHSKLKLFFLQFRETTVCREANIFNLLFWFSQHFFNSQMIASRVTAQSPYVVRGLSTLHPAPMSVSGTCRPHRGRCHVRVLALLRDSVTHFHVGPSQRVCQSPEPDSPDKAKPQTWDHALRQVIPVLRLRQIANALIDATLVMGSRLLVSNPVPQNNHR